LKELAFSHEDLLAGKKPQKTAPDQDDNPAETRKNAEIS
jgi:hypothetical protein